MKGNNFDAEIRGSATSNIMEIEDDAQAGIKEVGVKELTTFETYPDPCKKWKFMGVCVCVRELR